ncbi:MAG: hypothetical protein A2Y45_08235 [Tenericutes bacterium GWC2_34_14]|nr:MAG: hypothetical protein A2Z84_03240 [Tenericutes bacterium GWA2_35_7]OHE29884.1 MAG: hypothetical protein A2Y45_08235 [Tenericutes bacterium GWC2_34_14]OHE34863.1 MAG: hypothetical protein A2012_01845 [Tenericutes bacterium GWE2_34_108]OHE37276.1 MAG: hypothetical protein A2Y46_01165 [Tenericutes bacterium GWF1_35_14]OHE39591.1 MAG: hypothetical protein A2Y44_01695 [Tenericutes bacterium GWF2_35_184]OHE41293.1 MAG: hypothetical protein A3K26_06330 [Tenericutes bacterium RIFOXYA12_FULL_35_
MNLNQLIYDIILTYYVRGMRAYDTSIATNIRGSIGNVSKHFKDYYYFGKDKDIGYSAIRRRLEYLVKLEHIEEKEYNSRKYYEPKDKEKAFKRYLYIKAKNEELKKIDF